MFPAVKGWPTFTAALLLTCFYARAAGDANTAAVSLARKTAALAGRDETVAISYKNLSSLAPGDWSGVRAAFESALRDAGCRVSEIGAVDVTLTVSETPVQFLLVAEARHGEEHQVWIASWDRAAGTTAKPTTAALGLKQVWRQTEQILDLAFVPAGMLVLSPSKLTLYAHAGDSWSPRDSAPIINPKPWPRDLRGRLRVTGATLQVFLPGVACNGGMDSALTLDCRTSEAPWVLESNSRLLLATFTPSRNYFDGRVVTQTGARKTVPPFYSAAAVESQGRTLWVLAQTDGRTQITDASLDPIAAIGQWGSDIAGIDVRCGDSSQVIATRAGDSTEPDALQSFTISDHFAAPATAAAMLPGPVTALWPGGPSQALAVARDLVSGDYIAYVASVSCAN